MNNPKKTSVTRIFVFLTGLFLIVACSADLCGAQFIQHTQNHDKSGHQQSVNSFIDRFMNDPFFTDPFKGMGAAPGLQEDPFFRAPFEEMQRIRERMNRLMNSQDFFDSSGFGSSMLFTKGIVIDEEGEDLIVTITVPEGMSLDDLEITVKNGNILMIKSESREQNKDKQGLNSSMFSGSALFQRVVSLPVEVDESTLRITPKGNEVIIRARKKSSGSSGSSSGSFPGSFFNRFRSAPAPNANMPSGTGPVQDI